MKTEAGFMLGALGAYIYAIMPRIKKRPRRWKKVYYAHRGLFDNKSSAPENTLRAFKRAMDAGYGMEMDLQLTKDEQVVVFHDTDLKRVCGVPGRVCDYTYEELQRFSVYGTDQKIPLFKEVLELVGGRVPLIIELKYRNFSNRICEKADEFLKDYKGEYCIESFHPWALMWYRKHRPEIRRGQLAMNFQRQEGSYSPEQIVVRHLLTNFLGRPDFIAYDIRDKEALSKNICRKFFKCPSVAWTVRSPGQLEQSRPYYDYFIFEGFRP